MTALRAMLFPFLFAAALMVKVVWAGETIAYPPGPELPPGQANFAPSCVGLSKPCFTNWSDARSHVQGEFSSGDNVIYVHPGTYSQDTTFDMTGTSTANQLIVECLTAPENRTPVETILPHPCLFKDSGSSVDATVDVGFSAISGISVLAGTDDNDCAIEAPTAGEGVLMVRVGIFGIEQSGQSVRGFCATDDSASSSFFLFDEVSMVINCDSGGCDADTAVVDLDLALSTFLGSLLGEIRIFNSFLKINAASGLTGNGEAIFEIDDMTILSLINVEIDSELDSDINVFEFDTDDSWGQLMMSGVKFRRDIGAFITVKTSTGSGSETCGAPEVGCVRIRGMSIPPEHSASAYDDIVFDITPWSSMAGGRQTGLGAAVVCKDDGVANDRDTGNECCILHGWVDNAGATTCLNTIDNAGAQQTCAFDHTTNDFIAICDGL